MLHIPAVQLGFLLNGDLIAAIDLGIAGKARHQIVCTVFVAFFDQIKLIPKRRARAHNAHLPCKNVKQLGQLIQAGHTQHLAHTGDMALRIAQHMRGHIVRRVSVHGAEFQDLEVRFSLAHALLLKENGALGIQPHQNRQQQQQR